MSNSELACVYAALILADDDVTVTAEKINTIVKAAGVTIEPYWPGLFALESADLKELVTNQRRQRSRSCPRRRCRCP